MSIASELSKLQTNLSNVYDAIEAAGGTVPANKNLDNLTTAVESVPTPPDHFLEYNVSNGKITKKAQTIDLTGVTKIGNYALAAAYRGSTFTADTIIDMSGVTSIDGENAMLQCFMETKNISKIDLSNVTTISGEKACYYACREMKTPGNSSGEITIDFESLSSVSGLMAFGDFITDNDYVKNISFSSLETISGSSCFSQAFYSSAIETADFSALTSASYNCFRRAFDYCDNLTSVDFSSIKTINEDYAFAEAFIRCKKLTNVDFSGLETINGSNCCYNMFAMDSILSSINLGSLKTINKTSACYQMFYSCYALTSVDLSSLETVSGSAACQSMFQYCSSLESVTFDSLTNLTGGGALQEMFRSCISLTTLSFPALTEESFGSYTNQFGSMLTGCTGVTVHFPSNLQSVIGSWTSVTAGFGGTNTTVLFDLSSTATANVSEVNLTISLTGPNTGNFQSITINNNTYQASDFTSGSLTIQVPANTDLPWSLTANNLNKITPTSGTLNLSADDTLEIYCADGKV